MPGDYAKLQKLRAGLAALADGSVRRHIIERVAPEAADLARKGFDTSTSPTGARWRRLAHPRERGRFNRGGPLYDEGRLRDSVGAQPTITPDGWVIQTTLVYAAPHQYGDPSRKLPRRQYMPEGSLPRAWARRFDEIATALLVTYLP